MDQHGFQAEVSDADAVLQVEATQLFAALKHGGHILVGDVSTSRQADLQQVGASVAQSSSGTFMRAGAG